MPNDFIAFYTKLPLFFRILLLALICIFSFGIFIFLIEPETFKTPMDGIWWAIITASAVGYGDFVPKTLAGKITGIILILIGVALLSSYFIYLATTTVNMQNVFLEGKASFKGKHHTIIIGWNERAKEVIENLCKKKLAAPIVLIDETLKKNPLTKKHVHFIRGRANEDKTLLSAGIHDAQTVLITADQTKDEKQADMYSILTLLAVKGLNPAVKCVVEILTVEQLNNAKRAGADQVIHSNRITSTLLFNSIESDGEMDAVIEVFHLLNGKKILYRSSQSFTGKSFFETCQMLLEEGCLLLGVKRGENTIVQPPKAKEFMIQKNDLLLLICEE